MDILRVRRRWKGEVVGVERRDIGLTRMMVVLVGEEIRTEMRKFRATESPMLRDQRVWRGNRRSEGVVVHHILSKVRGDAEEEEELMATRKERERLKTCWTRFSGSLTL